MRYYRRWSGNQKGTPEDPAKCIANVPDGGRSVLFHQCHKARRFGPHGQYCRQHAEMLAKYGWSLAPDEEK